ncbi:general secretion pathway protein GspK [Benzoatithermus flavus]|uniref:T2SS protein K first SAM-like domain-containing protein n=1 Tax=Benzoatithermus flavus TaxID=3108223 RepID=A0ABU8XQJ6_9PROT
MTGRESERGAALVVTLVFAAAMAAAAVAFIGARQSDAVTMRAQAEAVQAQAALHAALQQTVALIANKTSRQIVPPQLSWTFDGVQVRVTLENEAGKVDINKAEEPLLRALPLAVGLRDMQAAALADTILDWRDENKLKRKNGAEDRDYAGAQRGTSGAANRPFAHPAELRYLPPVDAGVWARLAPLITIYSGAPTPEATKAPAQVRRALTIARGLAPSHDPSDNEGQDQGQGLGRDASGASAGLQVDVSPGGSGMASGGGRLAPAVSGTRESGLSPDAGRSSFASRDRTDGEDARGRRNGDGHDASGVQTVMLDVRFPNGYEAAARAVISLNPDSSGGSEPFVMLDWTPFIPDQGGKP